MCVGVEELSSWEVKTQSGKEHVVHLEGEGLYIYLLCFLTGGLT